MESATALIATAFGIIAALILLRMLDGADNKGIIYVLSTAILMLCSYSIGVNLNGGNIAIMLISGIVGTSVLIAAYKQITGVSLIDKSKRK